MQHLYLITFLCSLVLLVVYIAQWQRRFDFNITVIFILIAITNIAYYLMYQESVPDAAMLANKIVYIGGCFLPWAIAKCVANLCKIHISNVVSAIFFFLSAGMYACVLTIGKNELYYKDFSLEKVNGVWVAHKTYGPLHKMFYFLVIGYFLASLIAIVYSYFKKNEVSRVLLYLLFLPQAFTTLGYLLQKLLKTEVDFLPVFYVMSEIVYLIIVRRLALYEVSDMVIESMVESGDTGFVSFDFKNRYLGSNDTAKSILPALLRLRVDKDINGEPELKKTVIHWVDSFEKEGVSKNLFRIPDETGGDNDKVYTVNVNYLYDGKKRRGYQIFLADDTQNQKYIKLMDQYNSELEEEVAQKTERIVLMHDNLIMSVATMVESRDNSTGGHIRRTSEGVRILIDEMKRAGKLELSEEFCRNMIKAAPMHDLGKIAVDDRILRKPGRFEPKEFEEMKKHAVEGAKVIHEILKGTDDKEFQKIAENVAHYHHERWDGSGYPEGLKGEEIPFEARIMAIADVYDALVSKRVYKDSMSFEEADKIIMEGMGKHFDEGLKEYYVNARPKLEKYYSALEQ